MQGGHRVIICILRTDIRILRWPRATADVFHPHAERGPGYGPLSSVACRPPRIVGADCERCSWRVGRPIIHGDSELDWLSIATRGFGECGLTPSMNAGTRRTFQLVVASLARARPRPSIIGRGARLMRGAGRRLARRRQDPAKSGGSGEPRHEHISSTVDVPPRVDRQSIGLHFVLLA
jgi:hypothetical protein